MRVMKGKTTCCSNHSSQEETLTPPPPRGFPWELCHWNPRYIPWKQMDHCSAESSTDGGWGLGVVKLTKELGYKGSVHLKNKPSCISRFLEVFLSFKRGPEWLPLCLVYKSVCFLPSGFFFFLFWVRVGSIVHWFAFLFFNWEKPHYGSDNFIFRSPVSLR